MKRNYLWLCALTAALPMACSAQPSEKKVAVDQPRLMAQIKLKVKSRAIRAGQPIPAQFSSYDKNVTPDIEWTPAQSKSVKSYAVLIEDPDAPSAKPFVHWVIYNIPPDAHSLPGGPAMGADTPREAKANRPNTVLDGMNGMQRIGYYGPHPPIGDAPHHYHFEVFALDRMLPLSPDADRDALIGEMTGHVVGLGEFVATYQQK